MKKILFFWVIFFPLLVNGASFAQTFSIEKDTAKLTYIAGSGFVNVRDSIVPIGSAPCTISWNVIATDFPADWLAGTGICDNKNCYTMSLLWPSGTSKTSNPYSSSTGVRDFHMQINLYNASSAGTHYVAIKLNNTTAAGDTTMVYQVSYTPTDLPSVSRSIEDISLYPNPTNNDINVVYNSNADIKTIAVYNIIGKALAIYKPVSDNSANLSLDNVPAGIYFVRLINSRGDVVVTRKFTKQ